MKQEIVDTSFRNYCISNASPPFSTEKKILNFIIYILAKPISIMVNYLMLENRLCRINKYDQNLVTKFALCYHENIMSEF